MTHLERLLGLMILILTGAHLIGVERLDLVNFGDPLSERAHNMAISGPVTRGELAIELGTIRERRKALTLTGLNSQATITMRLSKVDRGDAMLEVEEIHQRQAQTLGYTINVNGQDIYFRTYDEMAAGPNHYFVRVPASLIPSEAWVVTFRNNCTTPVNLGRVWAYADFTRLAESQNTYQPMAVAIDRAAFMIPNLVSEVRDPNNHLIRSTDPVTEANAWTTLRQNMNGTGYAPGYLKYVNYAIDSEAAIRQAINQALDHAIAQGTDLNLSFRGTEWGGHPRGPDGLGGYFSDINYSKVIFQENTNDFRVNWFSTHGNATWPTWNNAQLNDYLTHRLSRAVSYFQDRRDQLAARGARIPRLVMNQEWGFSVRDFNDATTSLARSEGVTLDLSYSTEEQKKWVFDNTCASATRFARTFDSAARANRVIVDRGEVRLPTSQTRDDNYFQGTAYHTDPYWNDQWAGWQMCASPYAWATGELLPQLPEQYFDYINARGKLAGPNMERACLPNLDYYQVVYQRGLRLITPLNYRNGESANFLPQAVGMDARQATPPIHVDRQLLSWRFSKRPELGPNGTVVESTNMLFRPSPWKAMARDRKDIPGMITYRITNSEPNAAVDLVAKLDGKITQDGSIIIAVGPTINALSPVATLRLRDVGPELDFERTSYINANLGRSVSGLRSFFLKVTLTGKYDSSACIKSLRISAVWPRRSGSLVDLGFTIRERRTCNLWIQDRAVYEQVAAVYRERHGADTAFTEAQNFASQGQYQNAYRKITAATSMAIPAGFAIRGHGQLGIYPIMVTLSDDDAVAFLNLTKFDSKEISGTITADRAITCTISVNNLQNGATMALDILPQNKFKLYRSNDLSINRKVIAGSISWAQEIAAPSTLPRGLPERLSGTYISQRPGFVEIETQDPGWWRDNPLIIPIAARAQITRTKVGTTTSIDNRALKRDQVDLEINSDGVITAMRASFGQDSGQIRAFTPPTAIGQTTNGIIELTNGHRYELSSDWGFTDLTQMPPLQPFLRKNSNEQLSAAFSRGKHIEIDYCPYVVNGRLPRAIAIRDVGPRATN